MHLGKTQINLAFHSIYSNFAGKFEKGLLLVEKHIVIEDVDPIMLYGANNVHLQMIKSLFPKLRIMARGNVMRVLGEEDELERFEHRLKNLRQHLHTYNVLTPEDILQIVKGERTSSESSKGVLVYSMSGRPIKSRSENQQSLIDAYDSHDMVFAVGPAGTGKTYLSIALAVRALKEKSAKKIILCRRRETRFPARRHER